MLLLRSASTGQNCPACREQYLKCDKHNHFAIRGTTEKPGFNNRAKDERKKAFGKQINKTSGDAESSSESDEEFMSQASNTVSHWDREVTKTPY